MSHRIERDWLRRIPGYVPGGEQPVWRRRRRPTGKPNAEDDERRDSEEDEAAEALAEDDEGRQAREDDQPPEDDGEPGAEQEDADGEGDSPDEDARRADDADGPSAEGEPEDDARSADGGDEKVPEDLDTSLDVPEEVREDKRREREKQRQGLNRNFAPQAFDLEGRYVRRLGTEFARMVSKLAEDSADMPAQGDEEWDLDELVRRRFTGRLISQCRMTREKRRVVVVLDTSPSCAHQARLFANIARIAEELGDCELYDAPNFVLHAHKERGDWEPLPEAQREWHFRGRVVLAFGDFDGIERICQASALRGNKIYWFCCEERPMVLESQRDYFVKHYKGHYLPAANMNRLMHAMRRVR